MKRVLLLWLGVFCIVTLASIFFFTSKLNTVGALSKVTNWIGGNKNVGDNFELKFTGDEIKQLIQVSQHIVKAHRYTRSTVATYELNEAFKILNRVIDVSYFNLITDKLSSAKNHSSITTRNNYSLEVSPEIYMGMTYGYPYYHTGYVTNNNYTSRRIEEMLTILLNVVDDIHFDELERILKGISTYYPNVTVIVAYNKTSSSKFVSMTEKYRTLAENSLSVDKMPTGAIWKRLSTLAATKYALVGRSLIHFDNHTSLERLLRILSYIEADVVGGSHRFVDGRWYRGCYAAAMKNYTLKLVDGYDLSYNSCIYCDYISGPFMVRNKLFSDLVDVTLDGDNVFVDFFTQLKTKSDRVTSSLVCPDVMFVVNEKQAVYDHFHREQWLPYVQKWKLNKIILPNKKVLTFSCSESNTRCTRTGGIIMPICCLQELADAVKFLVGTLEKHNITIELEAGSGIGVVKMYGVTPYERDADFDWPAAKYKKLESLTSEFAKYKYSLIPTQTDYSKCLNNGGVNCGYFAFRSDNWRLELWGANYLGSDEAFKVGLKTRTKALFDGMWVTVLHSPAQSARNEYGDDIFEHVEHWSTLGHSTGWVQPPTGRFIPCPTPGFHGCLDSYLPVGNIQFQDVWI